MQLSRVTIVTGGPGPEHVASLESALGVLEQRHALVDEYHFTVCVVTGDGVWLDKLGSEQYLQNYCSDGVDGIDGTHGLAMTNDIAPHEVLMGTDVIFPIIHGMLGEDGMLLGLCEALHKPYVGCGILSSAICLDKAICKAVLNQAGIQQTPYVVLLPGEAPEDLELTLKLPWVIKPADGGCSIGVSLVHDPSELPSALNKSREQYPESAIVIEAAVENMVEVDVAVLQDPSGDLTVTPCGSRKRSFADIFRSWPTSTSRPRRALRPGNVSDWAIPAPEIPQMVVEHLQDLAIKVFRVVRGSGLSRVDFFYIPSTGDIYVNEINTMPSLASRSMIFELWAAFGITPPDFVRRVVKHALCRSSMKGIAVKPKQEEVKIDI